MQKQILSLFTPAYWREAAREYRSLRTLVFAGLIVAAGVILNIPKIPVAANLHISAAFLALIPGAAVFGPLVGLCAGAAFDVVGFFISGGGPFFPGYTLSAMLELFIYGLFLYRGRITVLRIFLARLSVNLGIHVLLGSLWTTMLVGKKTYIAYFMVSLMKNSILLPFEVAALVLLFQALHPFLSREGLLPKRERNIIPLF